MKAILHAFTDDQGRDRVALMQNDKALVVTVTMDDLRVWAEDLIDYADKREHSE